MGSAQLVIADEEMDEIVPASVTNLSSSRTDHHFQDASTSSTKPGKPEGLVLLALKLITEPGVSRSCRWA